MFVRGSPCDHGLAGVPSVKLSKKAPAMKIEAPITVTVEVAGSPETAWLAFTTPSAITAWNFASPDWCCPAASNDLKPGGKFSYRMEAKDGSMGFDFEGVFLEVIPNQRLKSSLGPDREVLVEFNKRGTGTCVSHSFTPDTGFPIDQQRAGWQAILDNYRLYLASSAQRDA